MSFQRLRFWCVLFALAMALFWIGRRSSAPSSRANPPATAANSGGPARTTGAVDSAQPADQSANAAAPSTERAPLAPIAAFTDWLTDFRRADAGAQGQLVGRGAELAAARRVALRQLIKTDPQQALDLAVSSGLRAQLPARIQAELEEQIDARGDYEVNVSCFGTQTNVERAIVAGGRRYEAFVFGRRIAQPTKFGLPIHGIAIDGAMAMAEEPFRVLDDAEKSTRGLSPEQLVVTVGGAVVELAGPAELDPLRQRLVAAESQPGPYMADGRSGPASRAEPVTAALTSPPSWINGAKRILWIKIDFSDDPGAAFTDAEIDAGSTAMNEFYLANSQDKTSFSWSILPAVLRMPKEKAFYNMSGSSNGELYTAARDAAKSHDAASGGTGAWNPEQFDRYIILHRRIAAYVYGGVAQIGGPRIGLNNTVSAFTIAHELGHCQSLYHSHYWLPSGVSPVGAGAHVEYGDTLDVMGGGGITQHFNAAQKYKLGYLDNNSVTSVTQPGTYRLARHDDKNAAGVRGLRIAPANLGYEFWVEHRQLGSPSTSTAQLDRLRNGVVLHWGTEQAPKFTPGVGTYLLDNTPGSAGGARDAAARTGETFIDADTGITIRPLAAGGSAPNEYLDVQVAFGAIDGNRNPTLQSELPAAQLLARANIIFNASAADPDGDPVYFRWDFGDGTLQPNLNSMTRRFVKGGDYALRVSAHDGKGGIASKEFALSVVDPLITWTQRGAGVTTQLLYDVQFAGGKFVAVGMNQTILTSPDGINWTRSSFPNGNSLTGVAHDGQRFVVSGYRFANTTQKGLAAYSEDGTTWTLVNIDTGLAQFWGIAHGAGRFVMVGDGGTIYHSADGATWTAATSGITEGLRAVTYAQGLFVATGIGGRVLTSTDGITWANRSLPTTGTAYGAARHNNVWQLRMGSAVYTSPDANTWTRVTSNATNTTSYKPISVGGVFLVGATGGLVEFAENQQTWASVRVDSGTPVFRAATVGEGRVVVVGANGLIYSADVPTASSPPLPAPSLRMEADSIKVAAGKKNVLSASGAGFTRLELYANGTKVGELEGSAGALSWSPGTIGNYLLSVRGIDASGASVVSTSFPAVAGFAGWKWRNPAPLGPDLRGAVRAHDRWWIVGGGGTLATLDDAGNFIPVDFATTQQLNAIAYANGRFVIGTLDTDGATKEDIGGIWTSSDGHAWTPFLTGALDSANLNHVLFAADRWIALGTGGVIVTSADGINWPRAASGITQSIYSATTGNGLIVAVAAAGRIITSTNGLTWTERASGVTNDLRAVTFANGTFVAAGSGGVILVSTNGTTWARATSGTTTNLYGAAFVRGAFVVGGDNGTLRSSTDGNTWTAASLGGNGSGTLFIGGSGDDGILLGRAGEVYGPTSATAWRRLSQGTTESRQAVLYAGRRFVAVGASLDPITRAAIAPVQSSPDGITWTRAAANSDFTNLNAVTYGQDRYVAVGVAGGVFTSTDAITWTKSPFTTGGTLTGVAAGPGAFVAVNSGQAIFSSETGESWTQRASGAGAPLRSIAYGADRYVVVGDGGLIRHSTDATTWTAAAGGTTANLLNVGWFEDFGFIAVGNGGTMITSVDGQTWRAIETGVADSLTAIAKTPLGWVAAGGTAGTLIVSLDGESWSLSAVPLDKTVRGLAVGPAAIVAAGDGGALLAFEVAGTTTPVIVAQPVAPPAVMGGSARFSVGAQNAAGAVYQWMKDGVPIVGADKPVYTIAGINAGSAGAYTVSVTTAASRVVSSPAVLSFGTPSNPGRLINLSILTSLTSAADGFTFGVVIGGAGTTGGKALLVRAAGPSLVPLGVDAPLDDPRLEFFTGQTKVGENDNWGGSDALRNANAQVGAFPFIAPNSRDAALMLPSLASGSNSARISGTGTGTVLAELYDATPSTGFTSQTPRLINVSVLKHIGTGVTAGFVIGGATPRTILVRAVGPTLGLDPFGVPDVVNDPRLTLYRGSTAIGTNDNWGGGATLSSAFTRVGAFALPPASRDAALLTELTPGAYTVEVTGAGNASGVALIEVYEVP